MLEKLNIIPFMQVSLESRAASFPCAQVQRCFSGGGGGGAGVQIKQEVQYLTAI